MAHFCTFCGAEGRRDGQDDMPRTHAHGMAKNKKQKQRRQKHAFHSRCCALWFVSVSDTRRCTFSGRHERRIRSGSFILLLVSGKGAKQRRASAVQTLRATPTSALFFVAGVRRQQQAAFRVVALFWFVNGMAAWTFALRRRRQQTRQATDGRTGA